MRDKIIELLAQANPVLGLHGGGIELVDLSEDKVAYVRFQGACDGCAAATMTLDYGIREMLLLQVDGLEDVRSVNDETITHAAPTTPLNFSHALAS
jgi:Fe/S biogenesis protein NfuA